MADPNEVKNAADVKSEALKIKAFVKIFKCWKKRFPIMFIKKDIRLFIMLEIAAYTVMRLTFVYLNNLKRIIAMSVIFCMRIACYLLCQLRWKRWLTNFFKCWFLRFTYSILVYGKFLRYLIIIFEYVFLYCVVYTIQKYWNS